jgi:hypothetical protein
VLAAVAGGGAGRIGHPARRHRLQLGQERLTGIRPRLHLSVRIGASLDPRCVDARAEWI